ncbi:MAG: LysR family transcriptional regulator [Roseovarius sp.]
MPPLTALRAFSAFADSGTVVAAGDQLNVSHAAISQQIKLLEAHMNVSLVDRSARQMTLTSEGRELAEALKLGFGAIARTADTLTGADANRPLSIATTPMFAAAWLMPQLAGFHADNPGANLTISTTPTVEPLAPGGIDVALRYGDGHWPGLEAELLLRSPMVIVAAPALVGDAAINSLDDLTQFQWLEDVGTSEANNWLRNFADVGERCAGVTQLPGNLLLDGARDGQGVAVVIRAFVEADIRAGRLRVLLEKEDAKGYHIVTRPGPQRAALKTFVKWVRRCAKDCGFPPLK